MLEITVKEKETGKVLLEKEATIFAGVLSEGLVKENDISVGRVSIVDGATPLEILAACKQLEIPKEKLLECLFEGMD